MIYFVQRKRDLLVKIGKTGNPTARFKQLEYEYGPVTVLGVHAGGDLTEPIIHGFYSDFRVGKSEWFNPSQELFNYIEQRCHAWIPGIERDWRYDWEYALTFHGEFAYWLDAFEDFSGRDFETLALESLVAHAKSLGFHLDAPYPKELKTLEFPPAVGVFPITEDDPIAAVSDFEWAWI